MSAKNYLHPQEEILYTLEIRGKDKTKISEMVGVTKKRFGPKDI